MKTLKEGFFKNVGVGLESEKERLSNDFKSRLASWSSNSIFEVTDDLSIRLLSDIEFEFKDVDFPFNMKPSEYNIEFSYCDNLKELELIYAGNYSSLHISQCPKLEKLYVTCIDRKGMNNIYIHKSLLKDLKLPNSKSLEINDAPLTSLKNVGDVENSLRLYRCPIKSLKDIPEADSYKLGYLPITSLKGLPSMCTDISLTSLSNLKVIDKLPQMNGSLHVFGCAKLEGFGYNGFAEREISITGCPKFVLSTLKDTYTKTLMMKGGIQDDKDEKNYDADLLVLSNIKK